MINLVFDRELTVQKIYDTRKRGMWGYTIQGICWHYYLKENGQRKLTLKLIELLAGTITVELGIANLPADEKFPCI